MKNIMKLKNKKLFKNLSVMCTGFLAITPFTCLAQTTVDTKNVSTSLLKERQLFNNKYYHDVDYSTETVSTQHLNDYINAASDKLQCMLSAQGLEDDDITTDIVSTFKANCLIDSAGFTEEIASNTSKLTQAKSEARKLGIDIIDFDDLNNKVRESLMPMYESALKSGSGYSDAQVNDIMDKLDQTFISLSNTAQDQLWGDYEFNMALAEATANILSIDPSTGKEYSTEEINQQISKRKLGYVLQETKKLIKNGILSFVTDADGSNDYLVSRLADYTDNKQGWDIGSSLQYYVDELGNRVDSVSDADHICYADLASMFNYKYDPQFGTDYSDYKMWLIDDIKPKEDGERDSNGEIIYNYTNWLNKITNERPFSSMSSSTVSYGEGEIFPGYALHVKINNIEDEKDSHNCNVSLQIGISSTQQDKISIDKHEEPYVLWDETLDEDTQEMVPNVSFDEQLAISDLSLIKNISKNKYYDYSSDDFVVQLPSDTKPNGNGAYFEETAEVREKIDNISVGAEDEDGKIRDLSKDPLLLSDGTASLDKDTNITGIYMPDNIKEKWGKSFHTNQSLAMFADGIDTNNMVFNVFYALVDKFSSNNEIIHRLQWDIGGAKYDSLPVQFFLSDGIESQIDTAASIRDSLPLFTASTHLFTDKINYHYKEWDFIHSKYNDMYEENVNIADTYITYFKVHRGLVYAQESFDDAMVILGIVFFVLALCTGGAGALLLATIFALMGIVGKIFDIPDEVSEYRDRLPQEKEWLDDLSELKDAYEPIIKNEIDLNEVVNMKNELVDADENYDLTNPGISYSKKKEISSNILSIIDKYKATDLTSSYQKLMESIIKSDDKHKGKTLEEIEDDISSYENAWGSIKKGEFFLGDASHAIIRMCGLGAWFAVALMAQLNISARYFDPTADIQEVEELSQLERSTAYYIDCNRQLETVLYNRSNELFRTLQRIDEMSADATVNKEQIEFEIWQTEQQLYDARQAKTNSAKAIDDAKKALDNTKARYKSLLDAKNQEIMNFVQENAKKRSDLQERFKADLAEFDRQTETKFADLLEESKAITDKYNSFKAQADSFNTSVTKLNKWGRLPDGRVDYNTHIEMEYSNSSLFEEYFEGFSKWWSQVLPADYTIDENVEQFVFQYLFKGSKQFMREVEPIFAKMFPEEWEAFGGYENDYVVLSEIFNKYKSLPRGGQERQKIFEAFKEFATGSSTKEEIAAQDFIIDSITNAETISEPSDASYILSERTNIEITKLRLKNLRNYNDRAIKFEWAKVQAKDEEVNNFNQQRLEERGKFISDQNSELRDFDRDAEIELDDLNNEYKDLQEEERVAIDEGEAEINKKITIDKENAKKISDLELQKTSKQDSLKLVDEKIRGELPRERANVSRQYWKSMDDLRDTRARIQEAQVRIDRAAAQRQEMEPRVEEGKARAKEITEKLGTLTKVITVLTFILMIADVLASWTSVMLDAALPVFAG